MCLLVRPILERSLKSPSKGRWTLLNCKASEGVVPWFHIQPGSVLELTHYLGPWHVIAWWAVVFVCVWRRLPRRRWKACRARWWRHTWRVQRVTRPSVNNSWRRRLMRWRNHQTPSSLEETWTSETRRWVVCLHCYDLNLRDKDVSCLLTLVLWLWCNSAVSVCDVFINLLLM